MSAPTTCPSTPLDIAATDLAILAYEGLAELKKSQLRTLIEWVEAGGSLCVVPGNASLKDYHASFLNRAAHSSDSYPQFVVDPAGRLMAPSGDDQANRDNADRDKAADDEHASPALLRRHGLGRIAIVRGKLDRLLTGPRGRPAADAGVSMENAA